MNKEKFLKQLEQLLRDIPESERREAMEYYQNYFEDAGEEEESRIIEELGSPQEVAASIKKNLFGEGLDRDYDGGSYKAQGTAFERGAPENRTLRNILIAVLILFTSPFWIAVLGTAFGLIVAVVACLFGFSVAAVAIEGAVFVAGAALVGIGIANMMAGLPAVGLVVAGTGLLLLSAAVLGLIVLAWAVGRVLPWVLRAAVRLCKRPFQRRGASI